MDTDIHYNNHLIYYIVNWRITIHPWFYRWRGYATTNNNNNTSRIICNTYPSTNALSPSYIIYYIHVNTIINILILQIVCILHKSHHCIIYELGGNILPPTSVKQYTTKTRDLAISHLASQQLLYDVSCQPNSHHITQDILLHCGDICNVYENQYSQLGGTQYYNITHLQNSKHTYNNQPFVYHIG